MFYVYVDEKRAKKSNIAFYDEYNRAFGWINHEQRQASISRTTKPNIPENVIKNYVIQHPEDSKVAGHEDLERVERKYRKNKKGKNHYDTALLEDIKDISQEDPKVSEWYSKHPRDCIVAVKILSIEEIEDGDGQREQKKEKLKNAENVSMYHEYIETEFDPNASTIKEAIARNDYIKNECWVNELVEHYKDCPRKKYQLTREKILNVLKMDEEEFNKTGLQLKTWKLFLIILLFPCEFLISSATAFMKQRTSTKKLKPFTDLSRITIVML